MTTSKFYQEIKEAQIERQVEDVYNKGLLMYFPNTTIAYPWNCDGMIVTKTDSGKLCKLIIEYKLDELLVSKTGRAKVLIQVLFYLKRFEQAGEIVPNVCMIADKNECFVIQTNELLKYMDEDINWSVSPSTAHAKFPDLVLKIAENENINPFVFRVDENFSFKAVADKIKDLADNITRYVRVTEHNIATIFEYFCKNVIKNPKSIGAHDLVSVFIGVITDKDRYYQHPAKKNILVTPGKNVDISGDAFISFFKYFDRTYTPQEKMHFSAIADRLIEDTSRRNTGDFWTPTIWVDYAHKMIAEQLGENWKDEYVVWDNCCGSKNLTRDYKFKELYCSTLFQSELEIGSRYNTEATSFQFDFLNDPEDKLPEGLLDAFRENRKIVFLLNPPYAGASNIGDTAKKGLCCTKTGDMMKKNKIGGCSQNLYAQFLYRILLIKQQYNLTNTHIGIFCPTLFLSGSMFDKFRNVFLNEFSFNNAIQFKASEFADCADSWAISFSFWDCGETKDKNNFAYKCCETKDFEVNTICNKNVYNTDGYIKSNCWVKDILKHNKIIYPNLSSGINVKNTDTLFIENAFGYITVYGNNIDQNISGVTIMSAPFSNGHGTYITHDNFYKVSSLFAARKLIEKNWINSKDEYLAPDEANPKFAQFANDSIVYSLFHTSSNQSSLRDVEYKDNLYSIKNEFFWMSKEDIIELANENGLDEVYQDARTSNERYVYTKLQEIQLSPIAQKVLDKAVELTKKSFKYRKLFSEEHPEYQLDKCWDTGFYQLKALWKEYMKDEFDNFRKLYKEFSDCLRPQVYELGFLRQ